MQAKSLLLIAILAAAVAVPSASPVASAGIGDRTTGDPSCAGSSSSGSGFTGVYENPNGMLIQAGGEGSCYHTGTATWSNSEVFLTIQTRRGPVDAWWASSSNGPCSLGWQTPRGANNRDCPAGTAPPNPGWGKLLLGQNIELLS